MSTPAWMLRLEQKEWETNKDPLKMVNWLLNSDAAQAMPDEVRNARLLRYGYEPPKPKRKPGRPRKEEKHLND